MMYWHVLSDTEHLSKYTCHEPSWTEARDMLLTFGRISTRKKKKVYFNLIFGNIVSTEQAQPSENFCVSASFST